MTVHFCELRDDSRSTLGQIDPRMAIMEVEDRHEDVVNRTVRDVVATRLMTRSRSWAQFPIAGRQDSEGDVGNQKPRRPQPLNGAKGGRPRKRLSSDRQLGTCAVMNALKSRP